MRKYTISGKITIAEYPKKGELGNLYQINFSSGQTIFLSVNCDGKLYLRDLDDYVYIYSLSRNMKYLIEWIIEGDQSSIFIEGFLIGNCPFKTSGEVVDIHIGEHYIV